MSVVMDTRGKMLGILMILWIKSGSTEALDQSTVFPEIREYCERDVFEPKCSTNEAVLVRHAKYGRMRDGRCISTLPGTMGCSIDVKRFLDQKCSGRQGCDVTVASLVPVKDQPCPADYRSYLEVAYECVPVAYAQKELCTGPLEIKSERGYLSSRVAEDNGCGTLDSPWFVTVQPGQQIRFSLLDFGGGTEATSRPTGRVCHVYAIIKEERLKASETICANGQRETPVYTSAGNMVEVRLVVRASELNDNNHFMLHYEALGCPDISAPPHGWSRREGDTATVGCNDTMELYHLRCDGTKWKGRWNNCSGVPGAPAASVIQTEWTLFSQSHGVSIFVIVCIALGVGIIILTIGLIYLRRRSRLRRGIPPPVTSRDDCYNKPYHPSYNDRMKDQMYSQSENDYYKTWQMQRHTGTGSSHMHHSQKHAGMPLPPPPPYSDGSTGSGSTGYNRSRTEHIYESPKFLRKAYEGGGGGGGGSNGGAGGGGGGMGGGIAGVMGDNAEGGLGSPTEYYELDPDMSVGT